MKPVTELYEAAQRLDLANLKTLARLDAALKALAELDPTNDRVLLTLLDLVATHPERLGLVRWVAGLDDAQVAALRLALEAQRDAAAEIGAASGRCLGLWAGFDAALSGGEGGTKEEPKPTVLPAGKPATHTCACVDECACSNVEVGGKIKCQACPWAMPMYNRQWQAIPGRVWCRHQYEYDRTLGFAAKEKATTKRVLEAGKPPPFLRVGMILQYPLGGTVSLDGPDQGAGRWWIKNRMGRATEEVGRLVTWPLAEPFTVEGES